MANLVYLAASLDGFIADRNHGLAWLDDFDYPEDIDMGFDAHMDRVDALLMGRKTLDVVLGMGVDWPYKKPVFVLSNSMEQVPEGYEDKVFIVKGDLKTVIQQINNKGYEHLYIDGGVTVQNCLKEDLIDEMIITTIPTLLGGGIPLFAELPQPLKFKNVKTERFIDTIVQNHFVRLRD